jgi:cell division protein FtsB
MNSRRRRLLRTLTLIVGILIIVSLSRRIYSLWRRADVVRERHEELQKVQDENRRLKEKLSEVRGPEFVEQQARDKLGLIREGEIVVLIEAPSAASSAGTPVHQQSDRELKWRAWWKLFF